MFLHNMLSNAATLVEKTIRKTTTNEEDTILI